MKQKIETDPHVLGVWADMREHFANLAEKDAKGSRRKCNKEDFLKVAKEHRTVAYALRKLSDLIQFHGG
jgi:hypothetical protein